MNSPRLPIKTERLLLRSFVKSDIDAVARYQLLPEVQRYLDWRVRDRADCKAALEAMCTQRRLNRPGDMISLAVVRSEDALLVGQVSLRWTDATAAQGEVKGVFNPDYRGNGYASEALRAAIDVAFRHFRFHRIFARCAAGNKQAARLLKGLGMRLEAHYREHALFQGEWDEELHFGILDREWQRSAKVRDISAHLVA
jgi:RimJ/RimL family protein N-acetyltransferase